MGRSGLSAVPFVHATPACFTPRRGCLGLSSFPHQATKHSCSEGNGGDGWTAADGTLGGPRDARRLPLLGRLCREHCHYRCHVGRTSLDPSHPHRVQQLAAESILGTAPALPCTSVSGTLPDYEDYLTPLYPRLRSIRT